MPTLTATTNFIVAGAATETDSVTLLVVAAPAAGSGMGRLIHPVLGTLDYQLAPHEWTNMDGDIIIPPVWSSTQTLGGAANTLWSGFLRDVEVEERWLPERGLSMSMAQLRSLLAFWTTPVNPADGYVQWWPNYATELGFEVILKGVDVDGAPLTMNHFMKVAQLVDRQVTLKMRMVGYAE